MAKILRIFFIAINSLIALTLLLSSIAGWIPPSKGMFVSLLSYAFLPLIVLNVICSLLWLFFKRWEFLISLSTILLRCGMVPLFIQLGGTERPAPSEQRSTADELKVMTYNLHGFNGKDQNSKDRTQNATAFIEVVKKELPDVICAQEMKNIKGYTVSDTLKSLGYSYQYSAVQDKGKLPFGATVFSRCPIEYVKSIDESGRKIYADITKDEFHVRIVCVHMSSYFFGSTHHDVTQDIKHNDIDKTHAQRLFSKVKRNVLNHEREWKDDLSSVIDESPYPIVVAGDFNDTPASHLYYKISRKLKDSFIEQGRGMSITYNGSFPTYRIDYIFHSDQLHTLAYKRLISDFSDHNGVVAVFEQKK